MKLNIIALSVSLAILWAAAVFFVGLANLIWPTYGQAFLKVVASIYPGYHAAGTFGDMIAGSLYALVDGAIAGLVFGWLYNLIAGTRSSRTA